MRSCRVWIIVVLLLTCIGTAAAQETETGSVETGTGAMAEPTAEELLATDRAQRADGFRNRVLATKSGMDLYLTFAQQRYKKIMENRSDCRGQLRKANRDQQVPTMLRCLRTELQTELDLLDRERGYTETIPGATESVRTATLAGMDALVDAIETVMQGIASGVYKSEEDLLEARRNLHTLYRLPTWTLRGRLQGDRLLSWIAHLLQRIASVRDSIVLTEDADATLDEAETCLLIVEASLRTTLPTLEGYPDVRALVRQAHLGAQECSALAERSHKEQRAAEQAAKE